MALMDCVYDNIFKSYFRALVKKFTIVKLSNLLKARVNFHQTICIALALTDWVNVKI
jgi:hypothetical protein